MAIQPIICDPDGEIHVGDVIRDRDGDLYRITRKEEMGPALRVEATKNGWDVFSYFGERILQGQQRSHRVRLYQRSLRTGELHNLLA